MDEGKAVGVRVGFNDGAGVGKAEGMWVGAVVVVNIDSHARP